MKTRMTRILSALLCMIMTFVIFSGSFAVSSSAAEFTVGDIILFGSYPKTKVTDYGMKI